MSEKCLDQDEVMSAIIEGVLTEYNKFVEEEGEKSVPSAELRALSREISLLGNDDDYLDLNPPNKEGTYLADEPDTKPHDVPASLACIAKDAPDLNVLLRDKNALMCFARNAAKDAIYTYKEDLGSDNSQSLSLNSY